MISFDVTGSSAHLEAFLAKMSKLDVGAVLQAQARVGVNALSNATPADSGLAANSWNYEVTHEGGTWSIYWTNTDIENGFPVAIMIQYGHGTGTGGYVQGQDYINPAIRPVFDKIAETVWKAVTSA